MIYTSSSPKTRANKNSSHLVLQAAVLCKIIFELRIIHKLRYPFITWKMIQLAIMIQWAAHRGPIHLGRAEANSERANTRAVMEQKCHRNWKSVPAKLMFFLWGYVYLRDLKQYRIYLLSYITIHGIVTYDRQLETKPN